MQSSKEKLKNMASAAKEQVDVYKAKIDEKAEKATARTEEERVIAHENAKAKEAAAKMELHESKARHAAEKLNNNQAHYLAHAHGHDGLRHNPPLQGTHTPQTQYQPLGGVPLPGTTYPSYPPRNKHI